MVPTATVIILILLAALAVFQALLIAGLPYGNLAWGGAHKVLPKHLRIGSTVSILIYAAIAVVILEQSGFTSLINNPEAVQVAAWVVTGYFFLGVPMNALSRSRPERLVMTPVVLLLALTSLIVTLA